MQAHLKREKSEVLELRCAKRLSVSTSTCKGREQGEVMWVPLRRPPLDFPKNAPKQGSGAQLTTFVVLRDMHINSVRQLANGRLLTCLSMPTLPRHAR